jgi:hypothetical protein
MIDLQRGMGCIWNIDRAGMQDIRRNSDGGAPVRSISRGNFPSFRPEREFYSGRFE